jgi:hypothetical protein
MEISYRGYTFAIGTAGVAITKRSNLDDFKRQISITHAVNITGAIVEADQATLLSKLAALEDAFSAGGDDFVMQPPGGSTAYQLLSSDTLGGVRIATPVSYPEGRGTEFVNRRTFNLALEADIATPAASSYIVSYSETISYTGNGGARVALLEPLNGNPIAQQTHEKTICRAVQSGNAVGFSAAPSVPAPMFGSPLNDKYNVSYGTPKKTGDAYTHYPVSWSYQFESASPFTITPPAAF